MKCVLLIRDDLKMTTGKIISQVSHALIKMLSKANKKKIKKWKLKGEKIVILKVKSEEELLFYKDNAKEYDLFSHIVMDIEKTQIKYGTYTTCIIGPDIDYKIDMITQNLPLF